MCKILNDFVLVKIKTSCTLGTRKNTARTNEIRAISGNSSAVVTEKLFPKDTFKSVRDVIVETKKYVSRYALATTNEGERIIPVAKINDIRKRMAQADAELDSARRSIRARWSDIIACARLMRGSDFDLNQYPADPPLDDWFSIKLSFRPHPMQSPLGDAITERVDELEESLRNDMKAEYASYLDAAREDLMGRVKTTIGDFGRKLMRLRTDTYTCDGCGFQYETSSGKVCPRCGCTDAKMKTKEKKFHRSMVESLRELCDTLDVVLPEEVTGGRSTETIVAPLMKDHDEVVSASPIVLKSLERETKAVAGDLASLIAASFATDEE